MQTYPGSYSNLIQDAVLEMQKNKIIERIWKHDYTVWRDSPDEITNRLGWLQIAEALQEDIHRISLFKKTIQDAGYTHVLLLGMGGSSLAPEVLSKTFQDVEDRLWLEILDSTDPDAILQYEQSLDLHKTIFIVSTKSGGTAETLSAFKYFYNRLDEISPDHETTGKHFVAITDPGSALEDLAREYQFRDLFINDPNIGGRYSVLSYFGIVPAVLVGIDIAELLQRAIQTAQHCQKDENEALHLGAIMGELAKAGRNKITFLLSPAIEHFGDWVEQLIAESTGKDGKGILPVVGETIGNPDVYGNDRIFVSLQLGEDTTHQKFIELLKERNHPVITIKLNDRYDLGGQFFLWEMATAIAGHRLHIQPFDQPNVESAKKLARAKITEYQKTGKLEEPEAIIDQDGIKVIGSIQAATPSQVLQAFLNTAVPDSYLSIHAYINSTTEHDTILREFQTRLRDKTHLATTLGYGPRFLHSTGQLHKGDQGKGLFIQITADRSNDIDIPDKAGKTESSMTFGTLEDAQALGDRQALLDAGRPVIRFHFDTVIEGIQSLLQGL